MCPYSILRTAVLRCSHWQAVDTDEGDLASQQGKRKAAPDEAEEGLSETEGRHILTQHCCLNLPPFV